MPGKVDTMQLPSNSEDIFSQRFAQISGRDSNFYEIFINPYNVCLMKLHHIHHIRLYMPVN